MTDIKSWKKDFLASKDVGVEKPATVAQRFINIYRQLSVLGEEAIQRYNTLLMDQATPEVLIALTALPGGEEIREYINFVENKDLSERDELSATEENAEGTTRLPKAEELSPLWMQMGGFYGAGGPANAFESNAQDETANEIAKDLAVDSEKVTALVTQLNDDVLNTLKYVIIDSDIDKMQQNMNEALSKVRELQEDALTSLRLMLSDEDQEIIEAENKSEHKTSTGFKSKMGAGGIKSKKMPTIPKFSVKMTEEES